MLGTQFEQLSLPGMPDPVAPEATSRWQVGPTYRPSTPYPSPPDELRNAINIGNRMGLNVQESINAVTEEMPLFSKERVPELNRMQLHGKSMFQRVAPDSPETSWVPTYELESPQDRVVTRSVEHLTENDPVDAPPVNVYRAADPSKKPMLMDGNHRVTAALNRGQMLMPAQFFMER